MMKRITIIGLTLLGCLPFTARAENPTSIEFTVPFNSADDFPSAIAKAGEIARKYTINATAMPFEDGNDLIPDFTFEYRGPMERLRKFITKNLAEIEKMGGVGRTSMALFAGCIAFPYIASYVWGKIAKPRAEDNSIHHKRGYYSVAAAIPLALPLSALLIEMYSGASSTFEGNMIIAALCSVSMISSYFGHKHA